MCDSNRGHKNNCVLQLPPPPLCIQQWSSLWQGLRAALFRCCEVCLCAWADALCLDASFQKHFPSKAQHANDKHYTSARRVEEKYQRYFLQNNRIKLGWFFFFRTTENLLMKIWLRATHKHTLDSLTDPSDCLTLNIKRFVFFVLHACTPWSPSNNKGALSLFSSGSYHRLSCRTGVSVLAECVFKNQHLFLLQQPLVWIIHTLKHSHVTMQHDLVTKSLLYLYILNTFEGKKSKDLLCSQVSKFFLCTSPYLD